MTKCRFPFAATLLVSRRFVVTLLLILVPGFLGIAAIEALAWKVGETMPMEYVARWQSERTGRMWRGGDGYSYLTYKVARVRELKPEVIALGSSRANSFRGDVFEPYTFFNAGLTSWTFDHYRRFLNLITINSYSPKVLLVNFDYWMFSSGFDRYWGERFNENPTHHFADLKIVVEQLVKNPSILFRRLPHADDLRGLYAVLSGDGFRADGTLFGEPGTRDPKRLLADGTDVGVPPVELGDHIDPEQVKKFEELVAAARARNIAVIGIQVPYYAKILDGLNQNARAGIWREFRSPMWRRRFTQEVIFFDFADMPDYRDKPEFFVDSLHPAPEVIKHIMPLVLGDPRVRAVLPNLRISKWAAT
jgi:hypothetical protein